MGLFSFFYPWGLLLQLVAIVHFFRSGAERFWFFVILFLGPLGALVYILVEVVPDLGLLRNVYDAFGRRTRIRHMEAVVRDNPSAGNYEELADLYLEEKDFSRARECYDRAISSRTVHPDPLYRRGISAMHLGDFEAAVRDLEWVTERDPRYDLHRAIALLAHAYAMTGNAERADTLFRRATEMSTLSETYLNYASFLAAQNRADEARQWLQALVAHQATMPRYLRRRERHLVRKADALLKRLPAGTGA
jgi:hypothetical protein